MWEELRNDPFLRTVAVIVVGILLFGLLFNTMPGNGSGMMGGAHGAQGNTYSFNSLIGWLLLMLIRILYVVLIGAVLIGAFIWVRNTFFRDNNSAIARAINKDPILKIVVLSIAGIIGLYIIMGLLGSFSPMGFAGNHAFNPALGISWLLIMLIRVLSYVLIISLLIALAIYIRTQYDKGYFKSFMTPTVTVTKVTNIESNVESNTDDLDTKV